MAGKLRPLDVERETRPGKYFDGDGLYLVVKGATSRNWIYRYRKDGKERWLGLGSLKDVSLKNARMARDAARLRVKGDRSAPGIDVIQEKRDARENAKATQIKATLPIFEECAETYIRELWSIWSKKHRAQWPSSLKRYAYAHGRTNALRKNRSPACSGMSGNNRMFRTCPPIPSRWKPRS
jgi:hypothetical protein